MNWRRPKMVTIAPAEKATWDTLKDEEVSELCRWFGQHGAKIFLRLLATDQDNATQNAVNYAKNGETFKAAVQAAMADAMKFFPLAYQKALHIREGEEKA